MPQNNNAETAGATGQQLSRVIFSWKHQDVIVYHKDWRWYVVSLIILLGFVGWGVWQSDYFFVIFLVLFYLVVLMLENRPPEIIDFVITPEGIKSGKSFYAWGLFDHFFMVYKAQGIKNLYLEFKNGLRGRLIVPLDGQNAVAVRDYLLKYLKEDLDREAEPISEQLRRLMRL